MIAIQAAVSALIGLLATGGSEAAVEIFKGAVIKGAEGIAKQQQLRQLLEETFKKHPELLQRNEIGNINIKEVKAKNGGVAVGVNIGGQNLT